MSPLVQTPSIGRAFPTVTIFLAACAAFMSVDPATMRAATTATNRVVLAFDSASAPAAESTPAAPAPGRGPLPSAATCDGSARACEGAGVVAYVGRGWG